MPINNVETYLIFDDEQLLKFFKRQYPKGYTATELTLLYARDRSTISSHLASLEKRGKLRSLKDGRNNY